MLIVCDSSPLFALSICDKLEILDTLFTEVYIPLLVYQETTVLGKPYAKKIAEWATGKIVESKNHALFSALNLVIDKGEAEAITIYKEKNADLLLIDEKKGRKVAELYNVKIVGTLGILLLAKQKRLIFNIKPCIELLQQSTIRVSVTLYKKVLERAGEI